jgi:diadenosine tetraphosphatase ApaH/serine/threonine PP2A family protein phosphatase
LNIFCQLPLAAILQHNIFCVHGGICPEIQIIDQIKNIKKPVFDFKDKLIEGLVWSDPSVLINEYIPNPRKIGYLFGQKQIESFLENNSLKMVIRAHQCVNNGVEYKFNDLLVTVFSASNYPGKICNQSGTLVLNINREIQNQIFPSFQLLPRNMVSFHNNIIPRNLMRPNFPRSPNALEKKINYCPHVIVPQIHSRNQVKRKVISRMSYKRLTFFGK